MNIVKVIGKVFTATLIVAIIIIWVLKNHGFRSVSFALLANFMLLDWVAVVSMLISEKRRLYLPQKYYRATPFEKRGRIYRYVGVQYFKKLVAKGFLANLASIRFGGKRALIDNYYRETQWGGLLHLFMFVIISLLAVYALVQRWYDAILHLMFFNILLNGYPVLLQRYNRFRLTKVIQLRDSRKSKMSDDIIE
jgi:Mn2+/Fe2+ NRAMP family transporter